MHLMNPINLPAMSQNRIWILVICLWLGCQPSSLSPTQWQAWLAESDNGLSPSKSIGPFELSLQYLPPAYQAWQEAKRIELPTQIAYDSLYDYHAQSIHFVFTIAPNSDKASGDVVYSGIQNYTDYKERIHQLSFRMKEHWVLKMPNGQEIVPILAHLENTYGLTEYRKLHLVFPATVATTNLYETASWDIIFQDAIFETGRHHFVFWKKDWAKVPEMSW